MALCPQAHGALRLNIEDRKVCRLKITSIIKHKYIKVLVKNSYLKIKIKIKSKNLKFSSQYF